MSTVEPHRSNIMTGVQAKNLPQLIKLYLQGSVGAQADYRSFIQSLVESERAWITASIKY
nr:hypothetical protein [Legionella lytica]